MSAHPLRSAPPTCAAVTAVRLWCSGLLVLDLAFAALAMVAMVADAADHGDDLDGVGVLAGLMGLGLAALAAGLLIAPLVLVGRHPSAVRVYLLVTGAAALSLVIPVLLLASLVGAVVLAIVGGVNLGLGHWLDRPVVASATC